MSKEMERQVEEQAKLWSAIMPASEAAHAFARGLAPVAEGFKLTRGQMAFEEEPSSFEAALQEIKETAP